LYLTRSVGVGQESRSQLNDLLNPRWGADKALRFEINHHSQYEHLGDRLA
jgi:hypothetical protein